MPRLALYTERGRCWDYPWNWKLFILFVLVNYFVWRTPSSHILNSPNIARTVTVFGSWVSSLREIRNYCRHVVFVWLGYFPRFFQLNFLYETKIMNGLKFKTRETATTTSSAVPHSTSPRGFQRSQDDVNWSASYHLPHGFEPCIEHLIARTPLPNVYACVSLSP